MAVASEGAIPLRISRLAAAEGAEAVSYFEGARATVRDDEGRTLARGYLSGISYTYGTRELRASLTRGVINAVTRSFPGTSSIIDATTQTLVDGVTAEGSYYPFVVGSPGYYPAPLDSVGSLVVADGRVAATQAFVKRSDGVVAYPVPIDVTSDALGHRYTQLQLADALMTPHVDGSTYEVSIDGGAMVLGRVITHLGDLLLLLAQAAGEPLVDWPRMNLCADHFKAWPLAFYQTTPRTAREMIADLGALAPFAEVQGPDGWYLTPIDLAPQATRVRIRLDETNATPHGEVRNVSPEIANVFTLRYDVDSTGNYRKTMTLGGDDVRSVASTVCEASRVAFGPREWSADTPYVQDSATAGLILRSKATELAAPYLSVNVDVREALAKGLSPYDAVSLDHPEVSTRVLMGYLLATAAPERGWITLSLALRNPRFA